MSFKKNTIINYVGQAYVSFIGFIFVPIFVVLLGDESFGLISVFLMLQSWMYILDMGLSNTLSRETAKFNTKQYRKKEFSRLLRFTKYFYIATSLLMVTSFWMLSDVLANQWFKIENISIESVSNYLLLMGVVVCLRWLYVPLRSFLVGLGEFVYLSIFDVISATFRTPGCILFLYLFDGGIEEYFYFQLYVSVATLLAFFSLYKIKVNDLISSKIDSDLDIKINLSSSIKFALQVFVTVIVWMLISQFDKLYLSNILSLTMYGYLSIAILISAIVTTISAPFSIVLLPKLIELNSLGKCIEYNALYLKSANILLSLLLPVCFIIALFSNDILYAWTGSEDISSYGAKITSLYVLGNMFLIINAFAYYIQYSYGQLKLHVLSTIAAALICVPMYIFVAKEYGAVGTGWVWLGYNIIFSLFWLPYIQIKFISILVAKTFFVRVISLLVIDASIGFAFLYLNPDWKNLYQILYLFLSLFVLVFINFLSSKDTRKILRVF